MEQYLNALRDALRKKNMGTLEIEDIITDHREMIEEALANGLKAESIESMFGQVETLAASLVSSSQSTESTKDTDTDNPQPSHTEDVFSPTAPFHVHIKLTADSLSVVKSKDAQIHLTADVDWREKGYKLIFTDDSLTLSAPKMNHNFLGLFSIGRSKSIHFTLALPEIPLCTTFNVEMISGDVNLESITCEELRLKTISGDISSRHCQVSTLTFNTVSGDIETTELEATDATLSLVSGDANIGQLAIGNALTIETVSGDLDVVGGEAKTLHVRTVSGDFSAIDFYPEKVSLRSVSGDLTLKNSRKTNIEVLTKKTVSGSIKILH